MIIKSLCYGFTLGVLALFLYLLFPVWPLLGPRAGILLEWQSLNETITEIRHDKAKIGSTLGTINAMMQNVNAVNESTCLHTLHAFAGHLENVEGEYSFCINQSRLLACNVYDIRQETNYIINELSFRIADDTTRYRISRIRTLTEEYTRSRTTIVHHLFMGNASLHLAGTAYVSLLEQCGSMRAYMDTTGFNRLLSYGTLGRRDRPTTIRSIGWRLLKAALKRDEMVGRLNHGLMIL